MDPYQTLGVSKTASQDEIRNAYRTLAKKYHPDLNPGKKELENKFKDISAAYELIGTKESREKYNQGETETQSRTSHQAQQDYGSRFYSQSQAGGGKYTQGFGGGMSEEDLFENLFRGRTASPNQNGSDALYQMEINFKESILGSERIITLQEGKKLKVTIPPGIESGAKLRFQKQGNPGFGKGSPGDAYVEIQVAPLDGYVRKGKDVESEVEVSFIEGILGAEIKVETLTGSVMLSVPPGVNAGSRLRIRGKGVALATEPGDQIVILKVVLPKVVNPSLQAAIKEWGGKFDYDPRSGK